MKNLLTSMRYAEAQDLLYLLHEHLLRAAKEVGQSLFGCSQQPDEEVLTFGHPKRGSLH